MPVKVAIVGGTGHFGLNHLRAFQRAGYVGLAECVAMSGLPHEADVLEERGRQFGVKGYTDWKEMIDKEDVDGVTVVTPDFLHKEMALYALNAGKHVLVEKPLDVTVEGCEEITSLAEDKGLLLEVDFHKRHDPAHLLMRDKIMAGELGKIQYGYAHMEDKIEVPRDWLKSWAAKSSPNWFLGIHFYDLVRWMIGSNAVSVYATGRKGKLEEIGIGGWDAIQAHVQFENDAQVTFQTSWVLPDGFEAIVNQGVRLVGTEGVLECDTQDRGTETCTAAEGMRTWNPMFLRNRVDRHGREVWEGYGIDSILDFVENIEFLKSGGSLADLEGKYPSGRDGIEATRIAQGVEESIRQGSVVDV
jgi:predicted dehydrogenase